MEDLEYLWDIGYTTAAYKLGKLYRDGSKVVQDYEKAEQWFVLAAQAGDHNAEYALGKMLLDLGRKADGFRRLISAADYGNSYAMYRIGKELLIGEKIAKDPDLAREYFESTAQEGNQYAQYAPGKMLLTQDKETALEWLELSASQGNDYARYLMDHANDGSAPSILLSATRLLHHMSIIFRSNYMAPAAPKGVKIDSRRRQQLQEKRIALGHREDDHEDYAPEQNWEQTM